METKDYYNTCNKCGRPIQYATEPKCNYNDCCMSEYCGCKLGRIKEIEPTCDSTAVIPSITVESVEGITNLANCLVHVNDTNTTYYVDDKHRIMITWAGPVNIPGYDMKNNPNGYRDQIVTDVENETAVIYDKHGKGYLFGITPENLQTAINNKLDEMAADGTLSQIVLENLRDFGVSYEQFGAVGDGQTDDYAAIKATHDYANEHNLKVYGMPEKTYYVKDFSYAIQIKTDVDWRGCSFVIDDTGTPSKAALFEVIYNNPKIDLSDTIETLAKDQVATNITNYGNLIVKFVNSNKKDFIRTGSAADSGSDRTEYTRIDNNGYILDGIYFPFTAITKIEAFQIDEYTITIKNAKFETIANNVSSDQYYNRGINVTRSNVIFKNISHTISNETDTISPYNGFFYLSFCHNVVLKDCYLSGHKTTTYEGTSIGSYDINTLGCLNCTLNRVVQINSIFDSNLWSIHGSNYCKNLTFDSCRLSKIDAHRGIKDLTVKNCKVGVHRIGFCGWGKALIEDTIVYSWTFAYLRDDYGSWFDGDIEIKNCAMHHRIDGSETFVIFDVNDTDISHDYGYVPYMPNLKVNGFKVYNSNSSANIYIYKLPNETNKESIDYSISYDDNTVYPHVMKQYVSANNIQSVNGLYRNIFVFRYEIGNIYMEKTGVTADKLVVKTNFRNQENLTISLSNFNPHSELTLSSYDDTYCDLWPSLGYSAVIPDYTPTHRAVMTIIIDNCNNLHLNVTGRPINFEISNSIINQIQSESSQIHFNRMNCKCDNCIFDITHNEGEARGYIYSHDYTYEISNSTFYLRNDDTALTSTELCIHLFKSKNSTIAATNTILGCSVITGINLLENFSTYSRYYGLPLSECLNNKFGTVIYRKSGYGTTNRPNPTNGKLESQLGEDYVPIPISYFNRSDNTSTTFNGSTWI